jgi:hypothetical protein
MTIHGNSCLIEDIRSSEGSTVRNITKLVLRKERSILLLSSARRINGHLFLFKDDTEGRSADVGCRSSLLQNPRCHAAVSTSSWYICTHQITPKYPHLSESWGLHSGYQPVTLMMFVALGWPLVMSIAKLLALLKRTPFLFLGTAPNSDFSTGILYAPANLDLVSPL